MWFCLVDARKDIAKLELGPELVVGPEMEPNLESELGLESKPELRWVFRFAAKAPCSQRPLLSLSCHNLNRTVHRQVNRHRNKGTPYSLFSLNTATNSKISHFIIE